MREYETEVISVSLVGREDDGRKCRRFAQGFLHETHKMILLFDGKVANHRSNEPISLFARNGVDSQMIRVRSISVNDIGCAVIGRSIRWSGSFRTR